MEGRIIHHQNRFRFRPSAIMIKKLSYKIFEDDGIRSTAEYTRENYPILSIRRQYLISLVASKLCYLQRSSTKRCPTGAPEPDPFITAGFINIYQVIRLKLGQVVEVIVSQVRILLFSTLPRCLLGPTCRYKSPSNAGGCDHGLKLFPQEHSHFIEVETRLLRKVVTESFYHQRCHGSLSADSGLGGIDSSKLA